MIRIFIRLVLWFGLLVGQSVNAAIVDGLYESQQLVTSQGRDERQTAMGLALAEVLAKVSGRLDVTGAPGIAPVLEQSANYVQQYRYRSAEGQLAADGAAQQWIWFRFDEKAVNGVLRKNGLPVWGRTRPATLVWLALEQGDGRYMLGGDTMKDIREVLEREARRRGLAILLPLWDLEDQMAISFADVWGNFQEAINRASERYQAEAVLVGRMSLSNSNVWTARWTLYEGGTNQSWQIQGPATNEILSAGMDGTLRSLASRYAQMLTDDNPTTVALTVLDVSGVKDYARITKYLQSLEQVKSYQPKSINADSVEFTVDVRGTPAALTQTIKLGNVLKSAQQSRPVSTPTQNTLSSPFGGNGFQPAVAVNGVQETSNTEYVYRLLQ